MKAMGTMGTTKVAKTFNKQVALSLALLLVSILTGFIAGQVLRSNNYDSSASSSNITVTDNDQVITQDQSSSNQTITKTSTATVKDTEANYGYSLSAKLSQNTLPSGSTVNIASNTSAICPLEDPCTLTTTNPTEILETTTSSATQASGETTEWTVYITIPANTNLGNYIVDIEYSETAKKPLIDGMNIQDIQPGQCEDTAQGTTVNLKDTRDNKTYRVRKMKDGNCWMVDNLAYDINTAPSQGKPAFTTTPVLVSGTMASATNVPQYAQNPSYTIPNGGSATPSYLYNWCAALGDTSANCDASANAPEYNTVQGSTTVAGTATTQPEVTGICPEPFRLPKGGPQAGSSNPTTTANEFAKLDIAMDGTGANRNNANTYNSWLGTSSIETDWAAVISGNYSNGLVNQGSLGHWWSSTAYTGSYAYNLHLYSASTNVGPAGNSNKNYGFAVRCIL